jgi:hypothetical protein
MPPRPITATALGLTLLTLGGCAGSPTTLDPPKVKAVIQDLGGTPESIYRQEVLIKNFDTGRYASQLIFTVPTKDGTGFRIVDTSGATYRDFDDFLSNNAWPVVNPP